MIIHIVNVWATDLDRIFCSAFYEIGNKSLKSGNNVNILGMVLTL